MAICNKRNSELASVDFAKSGIFREIWQISLITICLLLHNILACPLSKHLPNKYCFYIVSSNINEVIKTVLFFTNLLGPSEYANLLVPQK